MEASLEYLQPLVRNNDEAVLTEYLYFVAETKLFCLNRNKREDSSLINNLLSSNVTAHEGLVVLANYIDQCPKEILSTNIFSWIQQAVKNLINPENGSLSHIAFKVLGSLLQLSSNFPEARKQIALNIIPKVLDHFVRESKGNREDIIILQCLEQTIKTFGKSCGFHKVALSKLIFQHLDSSPSCVHIAGKCYLALAICGSPGVDSENYIASWQDQQRFLLNSLHELLDHLFENISEANDNHKKYKLQSSHPVVPKVTEKSLIKRNQQLERQFGGLGEFFRILLLGSFPMRKRILPEAILGLVWRGLSTNYQTLTLGNQSIDTSSLVSVISKINLACLEILEALIISCSLNLISYAQLICRILTQALKWTETENWPFGVTKPHCSLRVKVYECLWKWLNISRSCSGIEQYLDDIISTVITDINHDPPTISLKVPTGKGKKRMREMRTTVKTVEESLDYLINPEMNSESCEASLKFVSSLLDSASTQMKAEHHKELQQAVVRKLISVQQGRFPHPYSAPKCRLALYQALLSLCQNSHIAFQPPTSYATLIFSQGIRDTSVEVSRFCLFSLRSIEKILRPICPGLDFPASEGNIERLQISTSNQEDTVLLNDSNRVAKWKRKNQQLTSTPLTNSKVKLISPGLVTPRDTSFMNLSDFESGENCRVVHNDSSPRERVTGGRESPSNKHYHIISSENDDDDDDLVHKNLVCPEKILQSNGDAIELTDSPSPTCIVGDDNLSSEQMDSSSIKSQKGTRNDSSRLPNAPISVEQSDVQDEDQVIDVHSGDSDNEMLNSFVDELIVE